MKRKRLYRKIRLKRLKKIYKRFRRSVLTRNNKFNLYELLEIIFHSFFYKDIYFLKNWFLLNYIKLHYKNQKKFLSLFRVFVSNVFFFYKDIFMLKGFYFIIKGKVGVTSNAKKKRIFFRVGPSNKSSKYQKIDFQQGVVKALSGTSGLLMILTYF